MIALIAVWLVAGAVLCLYLWQHGVSMHKEARHKKQRLELVEESDVKDVKLKRAAKYLVQARGLLTAAELLAREADVTIAAEFLGHSESLAGEALKILDRVRFYADDEPASDTADRPTLPSTREK